MAQNKEVEIPIICENNECENYGNLVNVVREINIDTN